MKREWIAGESEWKKEKKRWNEEKILKRRTQQVRQIYHKKVIACLKLKRMPNGLELLFGDACARRARVSILPFGAMPWTMLDTHDYCYQCHFSTLSFVGDAIHCEATGNTAAFIFIMTQNIS